MMKNFFLYIFINGHNGLPYSVQLIYIHTSFFSIMFVSLSFPSCMVSFLLIQAQKPNSRHAREEKHKKEKKTRYSPLSDDSIKPADAGGPESICLNEQTQHFQSQLAIILTFLFIFTLFLHLFLQFITCSGLFPVRLLASNPLTSSPIIVPAERDLFVVACSLA